jgi:hypothetical protein
MIEYKHASSLAPRRTSSDRDVMTIRAQKHIHGKLYKTHIEWKSHRKARSYSVYIVIYRYYRYTTKIRTLRVETRARE